MTIMVTQLKQNKTSFPKSCLLEQMYSDFLQFKTGAEAMRPVERVGSPVGVIDGKLLPGFSERKRQREACTRTGVNRAANGIVEYILFINKPSAQHEVLFESVFKSGDVLVFGKRIGRKVQRNAYPVVFSRLGVISNSDAEQGRNFKTFRTTFDGV